MSRFALPLGIFLLLTVVLFIGIRHSPDKGIIVSPLLNKPAPDFALPALDAPERIVRPRDLRGRWYLLNVWGTWCVACREEHEMLLRVRAAAIVPLVGIDWKDDDQQAQAWLRQLGNPYEVVAVDHSGRTAIDYGVYAAPETFLVSPQGIVVYKCTGELTEEVWNREIIPRVRPASVTRG